MCIWSKIGHYIPGVSTAEDIYNGDLGGAAISFIPGISQLYEGSKQLTGNDAGYLPGSDAYGGGRTLGDVIGGGISDAWSGAKNAFNAPYEEKKKGMQSIQDNVLRMQAERMAQKDRAYKMATDAMAPAHAAQLAVYGDPSTWRL